MARKEILFYISQNENSYYRTQFNVLVYLSFSNLNVNHSFYFEITQETNLEHSQVELDDKIKNIISICGYSKENVANVSRTKFATDARAFQNLVLTHIKEGMLTRNIKVKN